MTETLPSTWGQTVLGELCAKPQYGWTTKSALGPGLPYLRTTDISKGTVDWNAVPSCTVIPDDPARYLLRDGDIVVSRAGSVGISYLLRDPPEAIFASYLIRLQVCDLVLPEYVAYYLQSSEYWKAISETKIGIAVPNVNARKLAAIPIPLAPRAEQKRIVDALEEQFSRLDAAERGLAEAKWKLDSLQRSAVAQLFDRADWPWTTLGEIAELKGGVTKDSKRQNDPSYVEVPYLRVANVQRGSLDLSEVTRIRVSPAKAAQLALRPGDVLFNEGGDRDKLGRGWVWEGQIENCIHQNHVFRARLSNGDFDPYFISMHGNTWGQRWFETHGKQTTNLASLNLTTLKSFPVPAPPLAEQQEIVAELQSIGRYEDRLSAEIVRAENRSAALRNSLLAAAFSGRLVSQDPDDEPASVLLERIAASRPSKPTRRKVRT